MPEPEKKEENPSQTTTTTPEVVEPVTPPVQESISPELYQAQMNVMRGMQSQLDDLRNQNQRLLEGQQRSNTPREEPIDATEWYNNPQRQLQEIEKIIEKRIAPLQQFVQQVSHRDAFAENADRWKTLYPVINQNWSSLEPMVRRGLGTQEVTPAAFDFVMNAVIGQLSLAQMSNPNPQPTPKPPVSNPSNPTTPPYIPPNAPPSPSTTTTATLRPPNENEIRLARELRKPVEDIIRAADEGTKGNEIIPTKRPA